MPFSNDTIGRLFYNQLQIFKKNSAKDTYLSDKSSRIFGNILVSSFRSRIGIRDDGSWTGVPVKMGFCEICKAGSMKLAEFHW